MLSTYPGGSRGLGLLLLRSAVGVAAIGYGAVSQGWLAHPPLVLLVLVIVAILSGVFLIGGFLTPVAGALVATVGAMIAVFSRFSVAAPNPLEARVIAAFVAAVAAAVIPLGPGSFSIDSRLFGRREIIIPRSPRAHDEEP